VNLRQHPSEEKLVCTQQIHPQVFVFKKIISIIFYDTP